MSHAECNPCRKRSIPNMGEYIASIYGRLSERIHGHDPSARWELLILLPGCWGIQGYLLSGLLRAPTGDAYVPLHSHLCPQSLVMLAYAVSLRSPGTSRMTSAPSSAYASISRTRMWLKAGRPFSMAATMTSKVTSWMWPNSRVADRGTTRSRPADLSVGPEKNSC